MTLMLSAFAPALTACGTGDGPMAEPTPNPEPPADGDDNENDEGGNEMIRNFSIRVGDGSFTATLEDHPTARAFAAMLPVTVTMNEMNGNEKYYYLPNNLPTDSKCPGTIRNGDLMLYGSDCLVLFYETFSSSYSYMRIGSVDNPSGLPEVLGTGITTVTFSLQIR